MTYPKSWAEVREARDAWTPPPEYSEAFAEISSTPIEYRFCTRAFDILAPAIEDLDPAGVRLVLGAAHRINAVQFDGRQAEALDFLIANAHRARPPT